VRFKKITILCGSSVLKPAQFFARDIINPFEDEARLHFEYSVRTSKRTPHFTITNIYWLTPFKEIIAVYSENHAKAINTKCSITDSLSRWFI
jgi:hypothetical protein